MYPDRDIDYDFVIDLRRDIDRDRDIDSDRHSHGHGYGYGWFILLPPSGTIMVELGFVAHFPWKLGPLYPGIQITRSLNRLYLLDAMLAIRPWRIPLIASQSREKMPFESVTVTSHGHGHGIFVSVKVG